MKNTPKRLETNGRTANNQHAIQFTHVHVLDFVADVVLLGLEPVACGWFMRFMRTGRG
jgi:hypothetical protein